MKKLSSDLRISLTIVAVLILLVLTGILRWPSLVDAEKSGSYFKGPLIGTHYYQTAGNFFADQPNFFLADSKTLEVVYGRAAADKNFVYYRGNRQSHIHKGTFKFDKNRRFKDRYNYYKSSGGDLVIDGAVQ